MAAKETVVLYPGMGLGHLFPMVELAEHLLCHGFAVTVVVIELPNNGITFSQVISSFLSSYPTISFHVLPQVPPPSDAVGRNLFSSLIRLQNSNLQEFLVSLSQTSSIRAVVLDFFCTDALQVASDLGIPSYIFFPSSASNLAVFLHLPVLGATATTSFKDMGRTLIHFPGLRGIPASDMPKETADRDSETYKLLVHSNFAQLPNSDGILVNSFESLEPNAVRALKDGLCLPNRPTPDIYCVGPLIAGGEKKGGGEKHECLTWLDTQPNGSVVFLCFGSMGSFSVEQTKEMATGLENSGQRFLWAVRSPKNPDPAKRFEPTPEPDLDSLLPEGFLERTRERGFVVKSWAPQVEVLGHVAVGGFVTHCGWNSTLEGIVAGLPLICWPLYAEQRMNKVFLVEEMRVGVEIEGYDEDLVKAEEVEKKIRWLMESEEGSVIRERAKELKEKAAEATSEGGSSYKALLEFEQRIR
ncbi:anthocyanidin 5,3-O-glucosyltransferase-like [Typha latifolia]|uniref:anthocyanidin 5,3-O-glucosyltransferase-like n=1 Tax=Typha latifolia TaxID=4733 RepID=UPI003C2D11D5